MKISFEYLWGSPFCPDIKATSAEEFEWLLGEVDAEKGDIEIRQHTLKSPSQGSIRLIVKMDVSIWRKHFAPSRYTRERV